MGYSRANGTMYIGEPFLLSGALAHGAIRAPLIGLFFGRA